MNNTFHSDQVQIRSIRYSISCPYNAVCIRMMDHYLYSKDNSVTKKTKELINCY